jgi:hypothetical protein
MKGVSSGALLTGSVPRLRKEQQVADAEGVMAALGLTVYDVAVFGIGAVAQKALDQCRVIGEALEHSEISRRRDENVTKIEARRAATERQRTLDSVVAVADLEAQKAEVRAREERVANMSSLDAARQRDVLEHGRATRALVEARALDAHRLTERRDAAAKAAVVRQEALDTLNGEDMEHANDHLVANVDQHLAARSLSRQQRIAETIVFQGPMCAALHSDSSSSKL